MHVIDKIEELVSTMYKRGEEIGPFVHLGRRVYDDIYSHMIATTGNHYAGIGTQILTIQTSSAHLEIRCDYAKPADWIGINGRTLLDIIVEQELLGL